MKTRIFVIQAHENDRGNYSLVIFISDILCFIYQYHICFDNMIDEHVTKPKVERFEGKYN